jgi:hypothetical protein
VVAVGELINIWSRGYIDNQLCGCGTPFRECEFWDQVSHDVFGQSSEAVDRERIYSLQKRVQGYTAFPKLWLPVLRGRAYRRDVKEYAGIMDRVYRAIADVSGARVIVDSSKLPQYSRLLSEFGAVDMHLIHLVRDSRATSFSWQRKKVRTEIHWTEQDMDRYSVLRSSVEWDVFNLLLGLDKKRVSSYTLVRYEDLVRSPGRELAQLAKAVQEDAMLDELSGTGGEMELKVSHTVSGNPSRFESGKTKIKVDDEWTRAMPRRQRLFVTTATAPLLHHYRYPLRTPRNAGAADPEPAAPVPATATGHSPTAPSSQPCEDALDTSSIER